MDPFPPQMLPQFPARAGVVPPGDGWLHEIKHDGYRLLCRRDGEAIGFFSRNGEDWSDRFPMIAGAVRQLPAKLLWLDGELVFMTRQGRTCYGSLQDALAAKDDGCLAYFVFDLMFLDGKDICGEPLEVRKELLQGILNTGSWNLQFVEHIVGHGPDFFAAACTMELEGIVSKRALSRYLPGARTDDWLTVSCPEYEHSRFVKWYWWRE